MVIKTNLRQIASKLVDKFFERVEARRARGGACNTWRPAHMCALDIRDEGKLYQFLWHALDRFFAW